MGLLTKKQPKPPKIDNSENKNMILAYTDKHGVEYYGFIDPEAMPKDRVVTCERAARYANVFVSEKTLKKAIDAMKDAGGKGDYVTVFSIIKELEYRLHFLGESESLLEIAACYFLFKDEDPEEIHSVDIEKKIESWKHDKKARNFFLSTAMTLTTAYSQKSHEEILNFLNSLEQQEREKRLNRYIS